MKKEEVHKIVVHNFVNSIEEPHNIDPSPYFSPLFVSKTIWRKRNLFNFLKISIELTIFFVIIPTAKPSLKETYAFRHYRAFSFNISINL